MSDTFKLQFPTGDFTHTELAKLNGKTNQQVWTRYQQAIKDGVIISAGERKSSGGKGKPSRLWKVNPNPPAPKADAPVVASATDSTPAPVPATPPVDNPVQTEPVVVPAVAPATPPVVETPVNAPTEASVVESVESVSAPTEESVSAPTTTELPSAPEAVAPQPQVEASVNAPTEDAPITVPVVEVNVALAVSDPTSPAAVNTAQKENAVQVDHACPVCNSKLWSVKDATGFMVWCGADASVCLPHENPSGHGKNVKDAYEVLTQKFGAKSVVV